MRATWALLTTGCVRHPRHPRHRPLHHLLHHLPRHRPPRRHPRLRRAITLATILTATHTATHTATLATTLTATPTASTTGAAQVPRHEKMVRLTGRHPFNVEAPLPELWKRGFLTPASLHYVRNHGAAPC